MSEVSETSQPRVSVSPYRRYLWAAIALVLLLAVWGILSRLLARNALVHEAREAAIPTVITTQPHAGPAADTLLLPGSVQAYYEAPIYARTSGYLKAWYTDIGATVKKGELLAEIETPEVDQQLRQAEADLGTARANYELARSTNERWQGLLATESVSQQDADQRAGDAAAKAAAQQSASANLARLRELEGFKRVVAPFNGVVTQRNTDVGALINAGGGSGPAMFVVSDITKLRVYVNVPQNYVPAIKIGAKATITLPEYPNRTFQATVEASSQAVDVSSGTTRMQLGLDNSSGELMPGGYASVKLSLQRDSAPLSIPASALIFNGSGLRVATVGADDKVLFKTVTIARDLGREIELASGIAPDDRVVTAPPDGLSDGDQVRVVGAGAKGKPATASEKQAPKS